MPKKKPKKAASKTKYLEIHVGRAKHLPALDENGESDPFVRILLNNEEVRCENSSKMAKTQVCYKTRFPTWNEDF